MFKKKVRRVKLGESEVPLSSMIDIVFLLLIFFVVTQKPIIEETLLGVDLPSPKPIVTPPPPPPPFFSIDVNKQSDDLVRDLDVYYVNGMRWNFEDLSLQLKKTGQTNPDQTIIINCGPNARHQKLVQVLDSCAAAGLSKLNMVDDESIKFVPLGN